MNVLGYIKLSSQDLNIITVEIRFFKDPVMQAKRGHVT